MEDAMVVNKASYERGFAHGTMYKAKYRRLNETDDTFRYVMG
jgi:DNA-directed RNA polymerase I subunit RPA2